MLKPATPDPTIIQAEARLQSAFGGAQGASARLLAWYDHNARDLPWRVPPGDGSRTPDPYRIWLSEIMLQQTTVAMVKGYFENFLQRWPTVAALAAAPLDDVLHAWQGLGYYARARNLHKCARVVAEKFAGTFPRTETDLLELPGIGAYTAAAIAAIAFDEPATVVDGNVERVMARLHAIETPLPDAKPVLKHLAALTTPGQRTGDYAQAVMDLGATVCTPRSPKCLLCPWSSACEGHRLGIAASLPNKAAKKQKPVRFGTVWWITGSDGRVLLRRRPEQGLLGGMIEFPGTVWSETGCDAVPPVQIDQDRAVGAVTHVFTHFRLELAVRTASTQAKMPEAIWEDPSRLDRHALPTVMKKVARVAQGADN